MSIYKVRRGLSTPLKIQGMLQRYFYIWSGVTALLALVVLSMATSLLRSTSGFVVLITMLVIAGIVVLGLRVYFVSISGRKKLSFPKTKVTISNRDLLKILPRNERSKRIECL